MKYSAVLDDSGHLIGRETIDDDQKDGIDPGDLPLNGTYKWDDVNKMFFPLGHGFGKVTKPQPPFSNDFVLARIIESMGDAAPYEAVEWLKWFDGDLRRREEELNLGRHRRGK